MKQKKKKIGIYVFIITTISFVIIFLCVHLFLNKYIKDEAKRSIRNCVEYLNSPSDDSYMEYLEGNNLFRSSYLELSYAILFESFNEHYSVDKLVTEWCEDNPKKLNTIYLVKLRDRLCYIQQVELEGNGDVYAVYTDVSSAKRMCAVVEVVLVVVMVICDLVATIVGLRMGRAVDEEQDKQKKFFENASHELKTPLMSIQGFSEGLEKGIITDQAGAYKVIQKEVGKMSHMVDEILLLSKYDRQSVNYNLEEISVQELIGDVLDTFYMEIQNKHLKLDVNIEDKFISVDIDQMHRAVSNIISNGIRYAMSAIRIDFKDDQLSIWNDGTTLSDEDMKKVFERFYMGQGGSTGIGLSLAKEIIELHKFSVKAENYQDGVRFVIDMRK